MFLLVAVKFMDFHGNSCCFPTYISLYLIWFWFRNLPLMLSFSVMALAVLPDIRVWQLSFVTNLPVGPKNNQKIFFYICFNIILHLTLYNWHWHIHILIHWHLWQRDLQIIRKRCGVIDKTLVSLVTKKLRFEFIHSSSVKAKNSQKRLQNLLNRDI